MGAVEDRIAAMSKDEKYEELRLYLTNAGALNLNIHHVKADEAITGAPETAVHNALHHCARLAGAVMGQKPMTAAELGTALRDPTRKLRNVSPSNGKPKFSVR